MMCNGGVVIVMISLLMLRPLHVYFMTSLAVEVKDRLHSTSCFTCCM